MFCADIWYRLTTRLGHSHWIGGGEGLFQSLLKSSLEAPSFGLLLFLTASWLLLFRDRCHVSNLSLS